MHLGKGLLNCQTAYKLWWIILSETQTTNSWPCIDKLKRKWVWLFDWNQSTRREWRKKFGYFSTKHWITKCFYHKRWRSLQYFKLFNMWIGSVKSWTAWMFSSHSTQWNTMKKAYTWVNGTSRTVMLPNVCCWMMEHHSCQGS